MKKCLIVLLLILMTVTLVACDSSSSASMDNENNDINGGVNTPPEQFDNNSSGDNNSSDFEAISNNTYSAVYEITTNVQEQDKNTYDKQVDKDNGKWEENWENSSVEKTASVNVCVASDALATLVRNFGEAEIEGVGVSKNSVNGALSIILSLCKNSLFENNGLELNASSTRVYKNVSSGKIGSGLLLLEKSYDGVNWIQPSQDEFKRDLVTTNFRTHYGSGTTNLIYTLF